MLKLIAATVIAFSAAFAIASPGSAAAAEIYLKSKHSGKYVGVTGGRLAANTVDPARALRLDMVRLRGNKVAFRSVRDNKFVRAGIGQGTFLASGSPHMRGWETFQLMQLGNGTVALKSVQNGKLVRAGVGEKSFLAAVSSGKPRAWELFTLAPASSGGSAASGSGSAQHIAGTWRLISVATTQTGVLTRLSPELSRASRISIAAAGRVTATVGCNSVTGSISQNGGHVETSRAIMTRKACPNRSVMSAERSFASSFSDASSITKSGRSITLYNAARRPVMVLRRR